jgi:hypothetical protein
VILLSKWQRKQASKLTGSATGHLHNTWRLIVQLSKWDLKSAPEKIFVGRNVAGITVTVTIVIMPYACKQACYPPPPKGRGEEGGSIDG